MRKPWAHSRRPASRSPGARFLAACRDLAAGRALARDDPRPGAVAPEASQAPDVERAARAIHGMVYPPHDGRGEADWAQWSARYLRLARDLSSGALPLTMGQVEAATAYARRPASRSPGANFFVAIGILAGGGALPAYDPRRR